MHKRIAAYKKRMGNKDIPFYLLEKRLNLGGVGPSDLQELITAIRDKLGECDPVLIIIDTLSRMLASGDENGDGMRAFTGNAEALAVTFGRLVLALHHQGADVDAKRLADAMMALAEPETAPAPLALPASADRTGADQQRRYRARQRNSHTVMPTVMVADHEGNGAAELFEGALAD